MGKNTIKYTGQQFTIISSVAIKLQQDVGKILETFLLSQVSE
jgi:hypothetical protein